MYSFKVSFSVFFKEEIDHCRMDDEAKKHSDAENEKGERPTSSKVLGQHTYTGLQFQQVF